MNKLNDVFVKIQNSRYRLSSIKRYDPFGSIKADILNDKQKSTKTSDGEKYGIYIYFSTNGATQRVYHYYTTAKERDLQIDKLDQIFNISI